MPSEKSSMTLHMSKDTERFTVSECVTVACKWPNGLILRLFKMETQSERILGGGVKETSVPVEYGERFFVAGPAHHVGEMPRAPIGDGFALTANIPVKFWNEWLKQNADSDMVKNHIIFANETRDGIEGETRDYEKQKSGAEPIDPTEQRGIRTFNPREI